MIISRHKLIYIHAPKTAGNAIQSLLFDISDDDKIVYHHQNGVDRFEVSGPITFSKHSALRIYNNGLGNNLSGWRVMVSIRHPFERAISAYFSPHRWYNKTHKRRGRCKTLFGMKLSFLIISRPSLWASTNSLPAIYASTTLFISQM